MRNPKYPFKPAHDWDKCPACFENFELDHQCANCGNGFDDQEIPDEPEVDKVAKLLAAAEQWALYVIEDYAPCTLVEYLERSIK